MIEYNRLILSGNLTRDPEIKEIGNDRLICNLGLAVNNKYRNPESGNYEEEVCFIDVAVFGGQAKFCGQYMKKGSQVLIEGRLRHQEWTDKNGNERVKHSMVAENVQFGSSLKDQNNNQE